MKPEEFVVQRSIWPNALSLNWLGVIDVPPLHGLWSGRVLSIAPLQHKKNCGIRVGQVLFRLASVLGGGSSLVGGRVQFSSLLLRTDQKNT